MLLSLVAPRFLHVASATEDLWADPPGEYLATVAATEAYELSGLQGLPHEPPPLTAPDGSLLPVDPVGTDVWYHRRAGGHDITPQDWEHYLDHADRFFERPSANEGTR